MPDAQSGKIILVRHGETEANRLGRFADSDGILLTDLGRRQAQELARTIEEQYHPSLIYSSRFDRAHRTAEVIAAALGLNVKILPGVHERNFGSLRGQPYKQMGVMMRSDTNYDPARRWLWAPEGGESLEAVRTRAVAALEAVLTENPGVDIVVVTHGAVMESLAAHLAGNWENAHVPPNCGILLFPHK